MQNFFRKSLIMGLLLSTAACSANHKSIYRYKSLDSGNSGIALIDAKQREILTRHSLVDNKGEPDSKSIRLFCSAPSPDVYSVLAQSLSAGGSFGKQASPQSLQAAFNVAFSSSETGSNIPRTQTINMLRELMFRTCERYLNGGIDKLELSIQAVRDQRLMVSILAIEQLTGAVTPKPIIVGAAGSGTGGSSGEAIVRLDDARKAKESADTSAVNAKSKFDEVNDTSDKKYCDSIDASKTAGTDLTDKQKEKEKSCQDAKDGLTKATAKQATTTKTYNELSQLAGAGGVSVTTSNFAQGDGGLDRVDVGKVEKVANVVREIIGENFNDDTEVTLFCIRSFRENIYENLDERQQAALFKSCIQYIDNNVKEAAKKSEINIKLLDQRISERGDREQKRFNDFWKIVKSDNTGAFSAERLRQFVQSVTPKDIGGRTKMALDALSFAENREEALREFKKLPDDIQIKLTDRK